MASFNIYRINNIYYNNCLDNQYILSYISKFMAYNVQALQSISLVYVQKACLPVLLTLLCS